MQINLLYLAAIAFTPFPTALVGIYGGDELGRGRALRGHARRGEPAEAALLWHAQHEGLLRAADARRRAPRQHGRVAGAGRACSRSSIPIAYARVVVGAALVAPDLPARVGHRAVRDPEGRAPTSRPDQSLSASSRATTTLGRDRKIGPGRRVVVGGGPARGLLGPAGQADAVGAELGVAEVEADAAGEARRLRPRVGACSRPAAAPDDRGDDAPVHAEARCRACRCRAAARPRASAGRRRRACPASSRLHVAGHARWRGGGRGWAGGGHTAKPSGVSTVSTHATSSARGDPGHSAPKKRPERWAIFIGSEHEHAVEELVDERVEDLLERRPVENTSRNRTRIP